MIGFYLTTLGSAEKGEYVSENTYLLRIIYTNLKLEPIAFWLESDPEHLLLMTLSNTSGTSGLSQSQSNRFQFYLGVNGPLGKLSMYYVSGKNCSLHISCHVYKMFTKRTMVTSGYNLS